jgi:hypothetical protein
MRRRWRTLLCQQHLQGREHDLQELALRGLWYPRNQLFDRNPLLRG